MLKNGTGGSRGFYKFYCFDIYKSIGRSNMFLNMTEDSYAYGLPEFCCFKCYIFAGTTNSTFLLKTQFVMTM